MIYVFFREGMFYPLELRDDADACANAECNPDTLRVETWDGRIVWGEQPALTGTKLAQSANDG